MTPVLTDDQIRDATRAVLLVGYKPEAVVRLEKSDGKIWRGARERAKAALSTLVRDRQTEGA